MSETKKAIDWDLVEAEFRAGVKTLDQIGKDHGITKGRISQVAKAKGWTRNLAEKIRAKADAKVQAAAAKARLNEEALNDPAKQARARLVEAAVVDANADIQVEVRMLQRSDIAKLRALVTSMIAELEATASPEGKDAATALIEMVNEPVENESPEEARKRADRMRKMVQVLLSTSDRVDNVKKTVELLERLHRMERQAHGISDGEAGNGSALDDLLMRVLNERR